MATQPQRPGDMLAQISNGIVGILRECYGRGPTKAKTYLIDDYVFTVSEDILTTVERTLIERGEEALVREVRLTFQEAVSDRFKQTVEDATGRRVTAYHSQVTFHPAKAFDIFVLEPDARDRVRT